MRLAFLGTPDAAVPALRALVASGHEVVLVITRPDTRRGRGSTPSPSPVKAAALAMGLSVEHSLASLDDVEVDRAIVVAYGALIPASVLERVSMLNVHFSLLPRWRGAAPVERAILAGDQETGVGVMTLEPTLDTGPVHLERRIRVDEKTASQLTAELAELGASALVEVLASPGLLEHPVAQSGEVTYAAKIVPETLHLVASMSREELLRTIRLERAFLFLQGRRVRVLRAEAHPGTPGPGAVVRGEMLYLTGRDDSIVVREVQPEGSRPMSAAAWLSGARFADGPLAWT